MPLKKMFVKETTTPFFSSSEITFQENVHLTFQDGRFDFPQGAYGFRDWRTCLPRTYPGNYSHVYHDRQSPQRSGVTAEEAAKNALELIEEEERLKEKAARVKSKKKRKNEKKRLAKENALQENSSSIADDEQKIEDDGNSITSDNSAESSFGRNHDDDKDKENDGEVCRTTTTRRKERLKPELKREQKRSNTPAEAATKEETKSDKSSKMVENLVEKSLETEAEKPPAAELHLRQSAQLAASGNHLAATGQYELAVKYFTDAIKLTPLEFKLFGNRSLCLERMQQYERALADAHIALSMEPSWIKGLFRKGKALCGLKRYYDATLVFQELLNLDSSSADARKELERAQTLHLMEMGFTQEQSSEALRSHPTLEEALQSLFGGNLPEDQSEEEDDDWIVHQPHRPKVAQLKEPDDHKETLAKVQVKNVPLRPKNAVKPDLPSVLVASIASSVTYAALYQLFNRVGSVFSIKMLLDSQSAFVIYKQKEDCDKAVQLHGTVLEGSALSVQHCDKRTRIFADFNLTVPGYKRECFFWRTVGCTREACTFRHVPEHKGIDKDKFDGRPGLSHT